MTEHAPLAPSASARWIACPGSVRLCAGVPDVESEHAALGTFAHEIAATCLKTGRDAISCLGDTDLVHEVDEDMAVAIQTYLDAVRTKSGARGGHVGEHDIIVERKVRITDDVWGTADAIVYESDAYTLHVFDYKHGSGVFVPVENNTQLGCYAYGALTELSDRLDEVAFISIHVVQPRHHLGGWHTQTIPVETLESWAQLGLFPAIEATKQPDAGLFAGDHCQFCPVKATCPQLRAQSLAAAAHLFEHPDGAEHVYVADEETGIVRAVKAPPPATSLTPDQIAAAMSMFAVIETWMKAVREHAYTLANEGTTIPGHKLVDKQGHRKWIDPDALELVAEVYDVDIYAPPKLASPAQIEKRLPSGQRGLVELLAFKPTTGTTLVPDSDTRPAINAGDVFTDLPLTEGDDVADEPTGEQPS